MGNTQTKESRAPYDHEDPNSPGLSQESSISQMFNRDRDHGDRERTIESLESRREAKAAREARRAERERIARESERERSMREEHVDGGYLVTQGVYTGVEDYSKPIVRQMMIERKLAPFWKGLQDFSTSWTENQLVAVARGRPLPAADEIPEAEPEHVESNSTIDFSEQVLHNLTVPSSRGPSGTDVRNFAAEARMRARTTSGEITPDFQLREIQLPKDPQVNGQPIEAYLYKDSTECPICFLYYPSWINKTRCCLQDICSECFVQVSRKPPHLPEGENQEETDGREQQLISEPATCPYCSTSDLGIIYNPPPFSPRGLAYAGATKGPSSTPNTGRKRATSLAATDPNVVTTDRVRPGWELKLAQVRAETLRRSAAATALHHAAFLTRGQDSRLFGRRAMLRRGDSPGTNSGQLSMLAMMAERYNAANQEAAQIAATSPSPLPPRDSSRRNRMEDLEDMMMMEAIRLSLAAEQERQQREQKQEQKDKKKADKQKAKEDKKAEKAAKKSGLYLSPSDSSNQIDKSDSKGKEPARPIDVPGRGSSAAESPQSYLERSRAQILVNDSPSSATFPASPFRSSHLRNISGVSSSASSFVDTGRKHAGSVSSLDGSPNASGVHLPKEEISGTPPGGGAGLEPMFNFRSLAAMIGDEDKQAASPLVEHSEYALANPSQDPINLSSTPTKEEHPLAQSTLAHEDEASITREESMASKEINISTESLSKEEKAL